MEGELIIVKAWALGFVAAVDAMAEELDPKYRVFTWIGSLLIGAFGLGIGVASWAGLPDQVEDNANKLASLHRGQQAVVRMITSQECDRKGLSNIECRTLQRQRIRNLTRVSAQ